MNRKRVQRLWREEGLRVPAKRRKASASGGLGGARRQAAGRAAEPRLGRSTSSSTRPRTGGS